MIEPIKTYFQQDPLKILYLIGGSGGLWFWINQWRFRIRLKTTIFTESYNLQPDYIIIKLKTECINLGNKNTSIEPTVTVTGFDADKKKWKFQLNILETDRVLRPHEPRQYDFEGKCNHVYPFISFRKYQFSLSRGFPKNIYSVGSPKTPLNYWQYMTGKILFNYFKKLPKDLA